MPDEIIKGPTLPETTVYGTDMSKIPFTNSAMAASETPKTISSPKAALPQEMIDAMGKSGKSGFYYDNQLLNPLTSVSLHVNTETTDGGITWGPVSGEKDGDGWGGGYAIEPLITSILSEDYQTAISNSWSEFGADAVGGLVNSFKPYAPYLSEFAKALEEMNETEEEMKKNNDPAMNTTSAEIIDKLTNALQYFSENGSKLLNRTFVAQGARFSYYSGTGVGFGNLSMRFTIFSDWEGEKLIDVNQKLQKLYPYCFGKFTDLIDEEGNVTGTDINVGKYLETVGLDSDMANRFFKWQLPPAGFESEVKDIDICQKGTMKLKFGAFYSIDNLVVSDAQFNLSRQMVKAWNRAEKTNDIFPLSCDVVLTFRPASKFTDWKLRQLIGGSFMSREKDKIESTLSENIKVRKDELENYMNGM